VDNPSYDEVVVNCSNVDKFIGFPHFRSKRIYKSPLPAVREIFTHRVLLLDWPTTNMVAAFSTSRQPRLHLKKEIKEGSKSLGVWAK